MNPKRYLKLIKSCLLDDIYGSSVSEEQGWNEGRAGEAATEREVEIGRYWPSRAHTMIGRRRLDNIQYCAEQVFENDVPGDFIETGVWRGGATIFMRALLAAYEVPGRRVFVADSFEGLPPPDPRYPVDAGDAHHTIDFLRVSQEQVAANFKQYDLLDDRVVFLPGFFEDSLPSAPIDKLAILRLDGDMYSSTIQVLDNLYDKVSPGGFIIVDDYGSLSECQSAVTDFRNQHGIQDELVEIDWSGAFWRKS